MNKRSVMVVGLVVSFLLLSGSFIFAQENSQAPAVKNANDEVEWLWGEVVSLNGAEKSFLVKYVDYDSDTEKEMAIYTDDKTVFENVKDLNEIKTQDTVSVDYLMNSDKAFAKSISVVKVEELTDAEPQAPVNANTNITEQPVVEKAKEAAPEAAVVPAVPETK